MRQQPQPHDWNYCLSRHLLSVLSCNSFLRFFLGMFLNRQLASVFPWFCLIICVLCKKHIIRHPGFTSIEWTPGPLEHRGHVQCYVWKKQNKTKRYLFFLTFRLLWCVLFFLNLLLLGKKGRYSKTIRVQPKLQQCCKIDTRSKFCREMTHK